MNFSPGNLYFSSAVLEGGFCLQLRMKGVGDMKISYKQGQQICRTPLNMEYVTRENDASLGLRIQSISNVSTYTREGFERMIREFEQAIDMTLKAINPDNYESIPAVSFDVLRIK